MRESRGSFKHNGGSIQYRTFGGGPPVVLVHGFSLDHRMWRPQIPSLAAGFRVVSYDCRGFGRSSCPTGPYSHADDLRRLLEHLGIERAHLVGLSMGGRIALNHALSRPEATMSMMLMATDLGGYRHRIDWDVDIGAGSGGLRAGRTAWLQSDLFATVRRHPDARALVHEMVGDYSGWHWQHPDIRVPADGDAMERLEEIVAPTSVLVGAEDLAEFHEIAGIIASRVPNVHRTVLAGVGHLANLESPATVNELLWRHLMSVERAGR
ncbi:alpha/beta fold hydrolase [Streptacidiphilus sp. PAMC 29251]